MHDMHNADEGILPHRSMGDLSMLFHEEAAVQQLANQVNVDVAPAVAQAMIAYGGYAPSFGLLIGQHFRKGLGQGCLHLRVFNGRAWLHWDRYDPRRFPLKHFFESPALWVPVAGVALVVGVPVALSRK
jgi:hypothetical protein